MITKEMVIKYLDDHYDEWIASKITDICNNPKRITTLKRLIKKRWDLRNMYHEYDKIFLPRERKLRLRELRERELRKREG